MARIVAIDYGNKRVGIAVTDELQIIATALATVSAHETIDFLMQYAEKEEIECFVVGLPKKLDNTDSQSAVYIEPFIKKLAKTFPLIPIKRVDERFTSTIAKQTIIDAGIKKMKRRDKSLVDRISATLILQSYLEQKRFLL